MAHRAKPLKILCSVKVKKQPVTSLCALVVPLMSSAEFLRATIAQASAYSAATDPVAVAPTIIAEINSFRSANPDGPGLTCPHQAIIGISSGACTTG